jgi:nucleotide-binding universal stress UspA family protein
VGRGLHEFADSEQADLLVIGSCRRGLLGRVTIGDDTSDALNAAPCAVAIAPLGYAEHPAALSEIGVAYNGSPESEAALAVARALAAQHGAKVSAFEAVAVPTYLAESGAGTVADALPGLVDHARARITALGDVEAHAASGVPAEELARYSASLGLLLSRWLARLWAVRSARARKYLATAGTHRPLPTACSDQKRSGPANTGP